MSSYARSLTPLPGIERLDGDRTVAAFQSRLEKAQKLCGVELGVGEGGRNGVDRRVGRNDDQMIGAEGFHHLQALKLKRMAAAASDLRIEKLGFTAENVARTAEAVLESQRSSRAPI